METIVALNSSYFRDNTRISRLNELASISSTLSIGQLMTSTGCSMTDAFYVLLLLWYRGFAQGYFVIYDKLHPDEAIERREFGVGLPSFPYRYRQGDYLGTLESKEQIFFVYEFDLNVDLEFVAQVEV